MRAVMEAKSVHDPSHKLEVALVAQLHAEGWEEDQIVAVFSRMGGFSETKTRQQVRHALAKGYSPFKCETIHDLGGCLGSGCPSYHRIKGGT
jgi:DNA primase large subunit